MLPRLRSLLLFSLPSGIAPVSYTHLVEALVLADVLALVDALVLAEVLALVEALVLALVLFHSSER